MHRIDDDWKKRFEFRLYPSEMVVVPVPNRQPVNAFFDAAGTLAAFCDNYPQATLRFLTQKDMLQQNSIVRIVRISSTSSTPCRK
ncbi:MAG: hypothetical protein K2X60_01600 [Xanthobacteraceae bacterium]|nr:hypothetical protein [Xanthobacteraceae bacterium]